jgi:hypothetical protein
MDTTIRTELEIEAPPSLVYEVFAGFPFYRAWNPIVVDVVGEARRGERVTFSVVTDAKGTISSRPATIVAADPVRCYLEWQGVTGARWFAAGRHWFRADAAPCGTVLRHEEEIAGLVARLLKPTQLNAGREGFHALNLAIKRRAEKLARARAPAVDLA